MSEEATNHETNGNEPSRKPAQDNEPDLTGIPGLGPARRTALETAGVSSRAAFARLTVEQLVSLTGMGRAPAARALDFVRGTSPVPPSVVEADDPVAPDAGAEPPTTAAMEDDAPALPNDLPPGRLDAVVFRLQTAVSDVTRRVDSERITRPLERLLLVVEPLPTQSSQLSAKRRAKIANRLETLTDKLERAARAASSERALPAKRTERLRERIRATRRVLVAMIAEDKIEPKRRKAKK